MVRYEYRHAQRERGQPSSRAVVGIGLLALALAGLSVAQTAHWRSEEALWAQAQRIAPTLPDPWIHGAMGAIEAGELERAEDWLAHARGVVAIQTPAEQRWAHDAIDATQAVIEMRRGRLVTAARLLKPTGVTVLRESARGQLCAHYRSVCALAD